MKITKFLLATLSVCTVISCSKDDTPLPPTQTTPPGGSGTTPPIETPVNKAPEPFDLIFVADGSNYIDLKPIFNWNAAIDPEAEAVTYDLYLDDQEDPTTLVAANLTLPGFAATDSLHLISDYKWKVVAKDPKGASVSSTVNSFTTRPINFPDDPVTDNAEFSARHGHTLEAFNDNLWIIGGSDGTFNNDVWNSRNGENWRKVSPDLLPIKGLFSPRSYHSTVVFDNKLWVIGGTGIVGRKNDVWSSSDGISWTEVTPNAQFSGRNGHAAVVFQDKLWVIGGINESGYTNEVWSSSDGETWTNIVVSANFPAKSYHTTVVFNDKLWIIGGKNESGNMNDVWSTDDGAVWTQVTSSAEFPLVSSVSAVVFDDKIMLFGAGPTNEIWYSKTGKDWARMSPLSNFQELRSPVTTVFKNRIWVNYLDSKKIWAYD